MYVAGYENRGVEQLALHIHKISRVLMKAALLMLPGYLIVMTSTCGLAQNRWEKAAEYGPRIVSTSVSSGTVIKPGGVGPGPIIFFNGKLFAVVNDVLAVSRDSGRTWRKSSFPWRSEDTSIISSRHWVIYKNHLVGLTRQGLVSSEDGETWISISPPPPRVDSFEFVSGISEIAVTDTHLYVARFVSNADKSTGLQLPGLLNIYFTSDLDQPWQRATPPVGAESISATRTRLIVYARTTKPSAWAVFAFEPSNWVKVLSATGEVGNVNASNSYIYIPFAVQNLGLAIDDSGRQKVENRVLLPLRKGLLVSSDGGITWTERVLNILGGQLVVFDNNRTISNVLLMSADAGQSWRDLRDGLPENMTIIPGPGNMNFLIVLGVGDGKLYVSLRDGLYVRSLNDIN